jgi:2-polyprenyl-3-methyl-5-hydroxy-6-metoxy-1,4-benzoquinol methylase
LDDCEICGASSWLTATYQGPIRLGQPETRVDGATVMRCHGCGVDRLEEKFCLSAQNYETAEYRSTMGQGLSVRDFFNHSDPVQLANMAAFWPMDLRDKVVADIGCGAGSFLSHISGLAKEVLAIEPTVLYHDSLEGRGYKVFNYASEALSEYSQRVDTIFTFQVIEHVLNPRTFLGEISALLKPGGLVILATPNRDDVLLKLLSEDFPAFYYRSAHRWYFDRSSLRKCLELAGFKVESQRYSQTFGMSNALLWMKERKPSGFSRLPGIDHLADQLWSAYLETTGQADNIFICAQKLG